MMQFIKRRVTVAIGAAALALTIAACASQAKVQDQPLLNQLMAPNGMTIQQPAPAQQPVQLNQLETDATLTFDRVEQAPASAPASESRQATETKQYLANEMGCGGK